MNFEAIVVLINVALCNAHYLESRAQCYCFSHFIINIYCTFDSSKHVRGGRHTDTQHNEVTHAHLTDFTIIAFSAQQNLMLGEPFFFSVSARQKLTFQKSLTQRF